MVTAYASVDPAPLLAVARRYGATHILADPAAPPIPLARVFANTGYVVYRIEPAP